MQNNVDQTVEIKARCRDPQAMEARIERLGAVLVSDENQRDTFFRLSENKSGMRLKLREAANDRLLIGYSRPDIAGPKNCLVDLYEYSDAGKLRAVLVNSLGVLLEVNKVRKVYRLGRAKIHLDRVESLGDFVEIEILGQRGKDTPEDLRAECERLVEKLEIGADSFIECAYADLILKKQAH